MAKRGIASGETGRKHRSTDAEQGAHHFVYGPYAKPIMTFDPGDTLVVDTEDAFSGKITSETDKPSEKLKHPFLNPQSGPFAVSGTHTYASAGTDHPYVTFYNAADHSTYTSSKGAATVD